MVFDRLRHRGEGGVGAFLGGLHVEVVQVSHDEVVGVELVGACAESVVLAQGVEGRHERVALFSSLALSYRASVPGVVRPEVLRRSAVEEAHKG